jgi:NAD(P)-dependent dehydrogenase (short-subunit alcohol dehydrogenase family)
VKLGFEGRTVLVTGGGSGLGREYALMLAERGASVVVGDLPGDEGAPGPADAVVAEIEARGGSAVGAAASVATSEGGRELVETAIASFGRLDAVINNAGITRDRTIAKLGDDELEAVLQIHLVGAFNVIRPAWSHLRESGAGRIVNTSSNAGILGNFGQSNYAAAKTGLIGLTRVLALEGFRHGIHANVIAPMGRTPMTAEVTWDVFDRLDPALVAPVVAWLIHADCPVTGEVYSAAGGRVARFLTGLTPGFYSPTLTIEDVRDHFEQIRSPEGFAELASATAEIEQLAALIGEPAP